MAIFPRPVSPRNAAGDLWSYLIEQRPHKWPLLGVSAALTGLIVWGFIIDANTNTLPQRNKITYFQSWDSNRTDAQIILQQKIDLAEREIALRKRQQEMQKVADVFGIEWRKDAERNDARRREALDYLNADLDKKLKAARREAGEDMPAPATQDAAPDPVPNPVPNPVKAAGEAPSAANAPAAASAPSSGPVSSGPDAKGQQ